MKFYIPTNEYKGRLLKNGVGFAFKRLFKEIFHPSCEEWGETINQTHECVLENYGEIHLILILMKVRFAFMQNKNNYVRT